MFFLFILIFFLILVLTIYTSRIGIEIKDLIFDTDAQNKLNEEAKVYVYLLIFKKIKLFKNDVRKNMTKFDKNKVKFDKKDLDIKVFKNLDLKFNYMELLKEINVDLEKIDFKLQVGLQDAATTAIIVGVISAILGVILKRTKYEVLPIYENRNVLKFEIEGIFSIYLVHYIYKIILNKMRDCSLAKKVDSYPKRGMSPN